ncbi:MAG: FAD-binding oxidoreductase [Acidiferrobacterales bacterium]|nr:FAD-binding oxidoreductase [Acidiferrobacterales bacterium]
MYADDYQDSPYWWDAAPREQLPSVTDSDLPKSVDVLIIGSGYTGLNAALQTVRAGRSTLVVERDLVGYGCSSRNGGQAGTSFKPSLSRLEKKFGRDTAIRMSREGHRALQYLKDLIEDENIDCDFEQNGRLIGIHKRRAYDRVARSYQSIPDEIRHEFHMIPKAELRQEIGSDFFFGGCVLPAHGSLHPAKYHSELLQRVLSSGATVIDRCHATELEKNGSGFRVHTTKGTFDANDVILATNGYTQRQFRWHDERILPIGSFQIATEVLPDSVTSELNPNARVISDTQLIGNYFRLSPDHKRQIFGGRVTFTEATSQSGSKILYEQMLKIYPQLTGRKITHSWVGFVAYTTDISPHIGVHEGVHYAMGYCGSGITLSSYFGMRVGQKVLRTKEGDTELDRLDFRPWPSFIQYKPVMAAATQMTRLAENFI